MDDILQKQFLEYSAVRLEELTSRIETCLGMLDEERIWMRGSQNENAIGNLVLHLCGNVTQWILAGLGGAADRRQRDAEFAALGGVSKEELAARLRSTTGAAAGVIRSMNAEKLAAGLLIQGYGVTGLEAIYHVVEHFSMHTGQVLFAAKMLTGADLGFYKHLQGSGIQKSQTSAEP